MAKRTNLIAAILAGGAGTRLRAIVTDRPKPIATVAGRPFLSYILDQVTQLDPVRIVICTGFGADQVHTTIGMRWRGIEIVYSHERLPLGTGGALANALPHLDAGTILAMNGDSFCDVSLRPIVEAHHANRSPATLLLTHVADSARYGAVTLDLDNRITGFREKGASTEGWINAGVYLLSRTLLESIPRDRAVSLEHELFPQWIESGLYGHTCHSRFIDIGIPEDYREAQTFFRSHSHR